MIIVIVLIALLLGLILLSIWLIKQSFFKKELVKQFKSCNVVVAGKKGRGKDVVFQAIINARKEFYYTNLPDGYGGEFEKVALSDISVAPNTYSNFIEEKVEKTQRHFRENCDIYISDAGVYLNSSMDSVLYKKYPSLPIYYALSRHLANHNIHANVQNYGRLWKALREQADFFVTCKKTIKWVPFFLFTKVIAYSNLSSAERELLPIRSRLLNKYSKAEVDQYYATNGTISVGWIIQRKRKIKYDTRAFEKILYSEPRIK